MDTATTVRYVYEIIKGDLDRIFNVDLLDKKLKEKGNVENLTEAAILDALDLLRKMRLIEGASESAKEFRLTDLGLNIPSELVEKTIRIYMERNMCQDSRFT